MNKIRDFKMKVDKKVLGVGCALMCAIPSFAEGEAAGSGPDLTALDNLNTTLGTLNTKAGLIMGALAVIALTVTVGIIVLKLTKKGSRAG